MTGNGTAPRIFVALMQAGRRPYPLYARRAMNSSKGVRYIINPGDGQHTGTDPVLELGQL